LSLEDETTVTRIAGKVNIFFGVVYFRSGNR